MLSKNSVSSAELLCHLWLCDPMDYSTPGFSVHHQLLEPAQTHVHWVGDAIKSSHSLLSPPPPAFSLSQHPGLFQRVSSSPQMAKVLELQLQHQSFQCIFRTYFFQDGLVGSSCCPRVLSKVFSNTIVQKHQFFGTQLSLWSTSHNTCLVVDRKCFTEESSVSEGTEYLQLRGREENQLGQ